MNNILYLSATRNSHDDHLVGALSESFEVTAVTDMKSGYEINEINNHYDLVVYAPLNLDVPWGKLNFDSAYGLCMAYEINETLEKDFDIIARNIQLSNLINIDSQFVLQEFRSRFGEESNVTNFKYGCDIEVFFSKIEPKSSVNFRIVCTRSWQEIHQNVTVIEALDLLYKNKIDFQCTFIGQPPANLDLASKYPELFQSGKIKLLSTLNAIDMATLLNNSDIYVSASRSDGTSVSLLEAMVNGKIVVTTDFPANLDLVSPGINGFTFKNGDARALFQTISQITKLENSELAQIRESAQRTGLTIGNWSAESKIFLESVFSLIKSEEADE